MQKLFPAIIALGSIALPIHAAQAQNAPVSEDQARCFVTGVCSVGPEKKFTLTEIPSTATKAAGQPSSAASTTARPAVRSAPTRRPSRPAATAYVATPRPAPAAGKARQSLDMRLNFDLGSAQLTPDAKAQADVFAKVLAENASGTGTFVIEGHTDSIGSRTMNFDLSRRRAQSVTDYLVAHGVPASKLKAVGYGYDRPRDGLPASDARNRRVEIVKQ